MIFLKRSRGAITIERTFKDVVVRDVRWGYDVVVRIGRLNDFPAGYSLRVSATITLDNTGFVCDFA